MNKLNPFLTFSWVVSIIATFGSLYFSEVLGYIPCTLCWYQRILMYPLAFLLGVAVFKNDRTFYHYALPISSLGFLIALYHYGLQKIPAMKAIEACKAGIPCSGQYINWFGFITIPFLSMCAFLLITISFILMHRKKQTR